MPLPDEDIKVKAMQVAKSLINTGKRRFLFFLPEIMIIDEMAKIAAGSIEVFIPEPYMLDNEARERLGNNLTHEFKAEIIEERNIPKYIHPGDGMMVVTGYLAGERLMVLPDVSIMFENSSKIMCRKVFAPYVELDSSLRYEGWMELSSQEISGVWRKGND